MKRILSATRGSNGLLPGAEPFSLGEGPVGCLLVHGFTSTPYDLRACAEHLAAHGIAEFNEAAMLLGDNEFRCGS
ncbi:MAG: hypothetical protein G01um1014106_509 [Parcubacteria group bacterium Gr01-1014_106]|nr:MAG: hypothetical protein G01um1014106_509 [Parcubacteria group bacterium Gr01-1014_106]